MSNLPSPTDKIYTEKRLGSSLHSISIAEDSLYTDSECGLQAGRESLHLIVILKLVLVIVPGLGYSINETWELELTAKLQICLLAMFI